MPTDISPALLERYRTRSIGFVFVDNRSKPLVGSGVLVRFKHLCGILTCTHVADLVVKHAQIGIVSFRRSEQSQSQRLNIVPDNFIMLYDDSIGKEPEALDLCFIRLDVSQIADFSARFSFVDFEQDLQKSTSMNQHLYFGRRRFLVLSELIPVCKREKRAPSPLRSKPF
jgi:hypothetical protein